MQIKAAKNLSHIQGQSADGGTCGPLMDGSSVYPLSKTRHKWHTFDMRPATKPLARDALLELARAQNGLISRRQAVHESNITADGVDKLVARGRLEPVTHGIYRYPLLPGVEFEPYQVALLRTGDPQAVLSHETALDIYDVSDVNPGRYHVTVPRARRIRRADNDAYVVHERAVAPDQVTWWEQMRIVTLAAAIEQCLEYGTPTYLLRQAAERGARKGLLRRADRVRLAEMMEHDRG